MDVIAIVETVTGVISAVVAVVSLVKDRRTPKDKQGFKRKLALKIVLIASGYVFFGSLVFLIEGQFRVFTAAVLMLALLSSIAYYVFNAYRIRKDTDIIAELTGDNTELDKTILGLLETNSSGSNIETILNGLEIYNAESDYRMFDGVIALSAIIITPENKFFFVKSKHQDLNNRWVQPGTYYRTNKIFRGTVTKNEQLRPPVKVLLERIREETGLDPQYLSYLNMNRCQRDKEESMEEVALKLLGSRHKKNELRDNKLSLIPFFVQMEVSKNLKSSKRHYHLDYVYAFRLESSDISNLEEHKMISLQELYELIEKKPETVYYDTIVMCEEFMRLYRQTKFIDNAAQHCTFNPGNNTLWLRLSTVCNSSCPTCLLGSKHKPSEATALHAIDEQNLITTVKKNKAEIIRGTKLVVTGGETLLVKDVFPIIKNVIRESSKKITKISICTNGRNWKQHQDEILVFKNFISSTHIKSEDIKFVINYPAFDQTSYQEATGCDDWQSPITFMNFLRQEQIRFEINFVMTETLRDNIDRYVDFWKDNQITDIVLSYGIRTDITSSEIMLNKAECYDLYRKFQDGNYEIEFLNKFELLLSSCGDGCNGEGAHSEANNKIITISPDENGNYRFRRKCLDVK